MVFGCLTDVRVEICVGIDLGIDVMVDGSCLLYTSDAADE